MATTKLHVTGLHSLGGTAHLEKALEAVPRVESVRLQPEGESVLVEHQGADEKEIFRAVRGAGFQDVRAV